MTETQIEIEVWAKVRDEAWVKAWVKAERDANSKITAWCESVG